MEKDKGKEPANDEEIISRTKCSKIRNWTDEQLIFMLKKWNAIDMVNFDPDEVKRASRNTKIYRSDMPCEGIIIKDANNDHYFRFSDVDNYYRNNISGIYTGLIYDHDEIVKNDKGRKIYISVIREIPDENLKTLCVQFQDFITKKLKKETDCSIIINMKRWEYDIIANDTFINNVSVLRTIIQEFQDNLSDEELKYIPVGSMKRYIEDDNKPTLFSQYHKSDMKDKFMKLSESTNKDDMQKMMKIFHDSLYTLQKDGIIPTSIVVNNFIGCDFAGVKNNIVNVDNESDEISYNLYDFIKYIQVDKPEWYVPNEFTPKKLFTDRFNEKYNCDVSTNKMTSKIGRAHV